MRKALRLSEAISPCVLWIDEIEKAFSGVGESGGGSDVTTRLFGQFLTWMQEKENTVFIVATANNISKLPPEFLRKGRFDELFYVDLPNDEERRKILEIHLRKRHRLDKNLDLIALCKDTKNYSGADLEALVKEAIENCFIDGRKMLTTEDLKTAKKNIRSISDTLAEQIEQIKKAVEKMDLKPASDPDNKIAARLTVSRFQEENNPSRDGSSPSTRAKAKTTGNHDANKNTSNNRREEDTKRDDEIKHEFSGTSNTAYDSSRLCRVIEDICIGRIGNILM